MSSRAKLVKVVIDEGTVLVDGVIAYAPEPLVSPHERALYTLAGLAQDADGPISVTAFEDGRSRHFRVYPDGSLKSGRGRTGGLVVAGVAGAVVLAVALGGALVSTASDKTTAATPSRPAPSVSQTPQASSTPTATATTVTAAAPLRVRATAVGKVGKALVTVRANRGRVSGTVKLRGPAGGLMIRNLAIPARRAATESFAVRAGKYEWTVKVSGATAVSGVVVVPPAPTPQTPQTPRPTSASTPRPTYAPPATPQPPAPAPPTKTPSVAPTKAPTKNPPKPPKPLSTGRPGGPVRG